jgi:hypothetical protein
VVNRRVVDLLLVVAGILYGWVHRPVVVTDYLVFAEAGTRLLTGDWHRVYDSSAVQAGPVQLIWCAALHGLDGMLSGSALSWVQSSAVAVEGGNAGPGITIFALLGAPVLAVLTARRCRAWRRYVGLPDSVLMEGAIGGLALLWGAFDQVLFTGHPSQAIVPVLWLLVGLTARADRPWTAGLILGFSATWEIWGLLGASLLLLVPRGRSLVRGVAGTALVGAVAFLPFIVTGPFRMFEYAWPVGGGTVAGLLLHPESFDWWLRLLQAGFSIGASLLVLVLIRSSPHAVWLVPAAATAVRLLTDPVGFDYYWVPLLVLGIVGLAAVDMTWVRDLRRHPLDALPVLPIAVLCWWQAVPTGRTWVALAAVSLPALGLLVLQVRTGDRPYRGGAGDAVGGAQPVSSHGSDLFPMTRDPSPCRTVRY